MQPTRRAAVAGLGVTSLAAAAPAVASERPAPRLWYRQPAAEWVEALPVGSGKLGAMVFGGVANERLQLNEDTLWAGGPYEPINPEARAALPEIRRLIAASEYATAEALADTKFLAQPRHQMSYQTIGDLRLDFAGLIQPVSDYVRALDLDGAVATTQFRIDDVVHRREVFASAPDGVIVVRLSASRARAISVDLSFASPLKSAVVVESDGLVLSGVNESQQGLPARLRFECRVQVRAKGGRVCGGEDGKLRIERADEVVL
ncbi:MAG: glycoside hydrolase N-terminal domain-containing protein, partial [Brevundimonas sp.]